MWFVFFFPADVSARHLLFGQQLVCGVSFHVDFHPMRHTNDSQPSPAHQPEMQLLYWRHTDVIVTCRFRVTVATRNAHARFIPVVFAKGVFDRQ